MGMAEVYRVARLRGPMEFVVVGPRRPAQARRAACERKRQSPSVKVVTIFRLESKDG